LLKDNALTDVTDSYDPKHPTRGVHFACLFLVHQKNKHRLITDYTPVNPFLHVPSFHMDTVNILREIVATRKFQYGACLDVKNAFPHLAVREEDKELLLILGPGKRVYKPECAFFGLAPVPLIWTKVQSTATSPSSTQLP
jgi:hypothetical protein